VPHHFYLTPNPGKNFDAAPFQATFGQKIIYIVIKGKEKSKKLLHFVTF
jgi:hypothetical protein